MLDSLPISTKDQLLEIADTANSVAENANLEPSPIVDFTLYVLALEKNVDQLIEDLEQVDLAFPPTQLSDPQIAIRFGFQSEPPLSASTFVGNELIDFDPENPASPRFNSSTSIDVDHPIPLTLEQASNKSTQHVAFKKIGEPSNTIGPAIARQAIDSLQNGLVVSQHESRHTIFVQINPPELGQMNIHVEINADQVSAQIIVSEWASAELLAREKEMLVNSLSEFGFDDTTVDISHGSLQQDGESKSDQTRINMDIESDPNNSPNEPDTMHETIVVTGLNMVA